MQRFITFSLALIITTAFFNQQLLSQTKENKSDAGFNLAPGVNFLFSAEFVAQQGE